MNEEPQPEKHMVPAVVYPNFKMSEDGNPIVSLEKWEYELAFKVGAARTTANWGVPDQTCYQNKAINEPERFAGPSAAIAELAVAKYTNNYWHAHFWHSTDREKYRQMPDVGVDIEVRRVRCGGTIPVRRKDKGMRVWAAEPLGDERTRVEILGFVYADDYMAQMLGDEEKVYICNLIRPWADKGDAGITQ